MSRVYQLLAYFCIGCFCLMHVSLAFAGGGPEPTATVPSEPTLSSEQTTGITLSANVRGGGSYRVGTWVPVTVTVQNERADMVGEVRVSASRSSAQYAATLELPSGSRKSITVYTLVSSLVRRLTVRLFDGNQQLVQQQVVVDPHSGSDRLIGLVTDTAGEARLPSELPDHSKLIAVPLTLGDLPEHVAGLGSFDALVLVDVSTATLSEGQRVALREWVARGGQLIVSGGAGAERTLNGLPEEFRPVTLGALETVLGSSLLPGLPEGTGTLAVVQAAPAAGSEVAHNAALGQAHSPLLFERTLGKGVVSFATIALNEPTLAVWSEATTFWNDLLQPRTQLPPGFGQTDMSPDQLIEGNIASALTRLPALELPSLTQIGLLLLAYIALVGPITYLVLRRLDRQALGWIVVPIITIVFAAAAYGLGYAQRGGDVVINQVSVIEPLDDSSARVRSFVGLFSPSRRSYSLSLSGDGLLRPISLQGNWDTSDQSGVFQGAQASGLDVPQWSMRAVVADSVEPFAGLRATVRLEGSQLSGEVTNGTGQTLRDVVLVQDVNIARIGDMAPGERRAVTFTVLQGADMVAQRSKFGNVPLSFLIYNKEIEAANQQGGIPLPPQIQLRQGLLDALYAAGPVQRNTTPLLVAWVDTPPAEIHMPEQRVERQQLTLVAMEPQLKVTPGPITLEQGWLQRNVLLDDPGNSQPVCMGSRGIGVNLFGQPAVQTLTLPKVMRGLHPSELTLLASADGAWPEKAQLELYDWEQDQWVGQPFGQDKPLIVEQPARFLQTSDGEIRARLNGETNPQMGGGCLYLDASVKGELP